jgi:hypothetical protein
LQKKSYHAKKSKVLKYIIKHDPKQKKNCKHQKNAHVATEKINCSKNAHMATDHMMSLLLCLTHWTFAVHME